MKMKTTLGLVALCLLTALAMAPTATAATSNSTNACVSDAEAITPSSGSCGANRDRWGTVADDTLGCVTTYIWEPLKGC